MALANETVCVETNQFTTPYNDNELIPAFQGIMFDLSSLTTGLEIWAIEFDVRLDVAESLEVEIFTKPNGFIEDMSNEDAWTKVADAKAKPRPNGNGVVVSDVDFDPIVLQAMQRQAMYIQMKGPWIDVRAEALDKTGESQKQTDDMVIFVGAGLDSRFADHVSTSIDPQFSGVIHYRKRVPCEQGILTRVEFPLLIGHVPNPVFLGLLQDALDEIVQEQLLKAAHFRDMVTDFALRFGQATEIETVSSDIECPEEWEYCPTLFLNGILALRHDDKLRPGQLRFQVYRAAAAIVGELRKKIALLEIIYIGPQPSAASFHMTFVGAPDELLHEDVDFFEQANTMFLDTNIKEKSDGIQILDTVTYRSRERRLRGLFSEMTLSGQILGVQPGFLPLGSFVLEVSDEMHSSKANYVKMLQFGLSMLSNGVMVSSNAFEDVRDMTVSLDYYKITDVTLGPQSSPAFSFQGAMILLSVILAIAVPLTAYFCLRSAKAREQDRKAVTAYREKTREDRRNKREESSVEATTAKSLEENFTDELDAAFELGYEEYKKKVEICGLNALSHHDLATNETSLHKISSQHGKKLERSASTHSLSLSLNHSIVDSELDDDLSGSSFETDCDDNNDAASIASGSVSVASGASLRSERSLLSVFLEKQAEKQRNQGLQMSSDHSSSMPDIPFRDSLRAQTEHGPRRGLSYMGSQYNDPRHGVVRAHSSDLSIMRGRNPHPQRGQGPVRTKSDPNISLDTDFRLNFDRPSRHQAPGQLGSSKRSFSEHLPHQQITRPGNLHRVAPQRQNSEGSSKADPERGLESQLSQRLHHLLPPSAKDNSSREGPTDKPALCPTRKSSSLSMPDSKEKLQLPDQSARVLLKLRRESARALVPEKDQIEKNRNAPGRAASDEERSQTLESNAMRTRRAPSRHTSAPLSQCVHLSLHDDMIRQRECLAEEFLDSDESTNSDSTKEMTDETSSPSSEGKVLKSCAPRERPRKKRSTDEKVPTESRNAEKLSRKIDKFLSDSHIGGMQISDEKKKKSKNKKKKKGKKKGKNPEEGSCSDCDISVGAQSLDEHVLVYGQKKQKRGKRPKAYV